MAKRTRTPRLDETWRQKIKTSMLINRLQDHVFNKVELSKTQISAIKILLAKTAPDLSNIEMTGADGKDLIPESINLNFIKPNEPPTT